MTSDRTHTPKVHVSNDFELSLLDSAMGYSVDLVLLLVQYTMGNSTSSAWFINPDIFVQLYTMTFNIWWIQTHTPKVHVTNDL